MTTQRDVKRGVAGAEVEVVMENIAAIVIIEDTGIIESTENIANTGTVAEIQMRRGQGEIAAGVARVEEGEAGKGGTMAGMMSAETDGVAATVPKTVAEAFIRR